MRRAVMAMTLAALAATWAPAGAQDAVLRTRERANMLTQFRALLEHTDAATRMAAFEEAMASKDQALKTMAMDAALGGSDDNLKTAALRTFLDGRKTLLIKVILPERPTDGIVKEFNRWNTLMITDIAVKDNVITGTYDKFETLKGGQMIPGGFVLSFSYNSNCALTARLVAAKQLAGNLDCSHKGNWATEIAMTRTSLPVRIDLP